MEGWLNYGGAWRWADCKRDEILFGPSPLTDEESVTYNSSDVARDQKALSFPDGIQEMDINKKSGTDWSVTYNNETLRFKAKGPGDKRAWLRIMRGFTAPSQTPAIVRDALLAGLDFLAQHTTEQGLFRISVARDQRHRLMNSLLIFQKLPIHPSTDPHCVAGVVKALLRSMPETLLSVKLYEEFIDAGVKDDANMLGSLVNQLPQDSKNILAALIKVTAGLEYHESSSRMNADNIGKLLGVGLLVSENDMSELMSVKEVYPLLFRALIDHCEALFGFNVERTFGASQLQEQEQELTNAQEEEKQDGLQEQQGGAQDGGIEVDGLQQQQQQQQQHEEAFQYDNEQQQDHEEEQGYTGDLTYEKSQTRRDPVEHVSYDNNNNNDSNYTQQQPLHNDNNDEFEGKGLEGNDDDYARSMRYDEEDDRYHSGDDLDGYAEGNMAPITPSATKTRGKIKDYVTPSIENLKRFAKIVNTLMSCHQREQIKGGEITRLLSENAAFERKSSSLATVWAEFASSYRNLEHERTVVLRYLDMNVAKQIPILIFNQKEHKVSLSKRNRHADKLNRREDGVDRMSNASLASRQQNKVYETAQKADASHREFHYSALELETDRIAKTKEMLRIIAKSQLYFYVRQLQYWAKVKKYLNRMDSEADAANVFAAMKSLDYTGRQNKPYL